MQGKKFISPGAWFSMNYPSDWNEFEDGEGSFLFYNPDVWSGNFRISAFKGKAGYGKEAIRQDPCLCRELIDLHLVIVLHVTAPP